jgi:hypothetical protein
MRTQRFDEEEHEVNRATGDKLLERRAEISGTIAKSSHESR